MDFQGFKDPSLGSIAKKMQNLDCSLLGNGEEWWLSELLFSPGAHRLQLLEWILTKMNINKPKVPVQSASHVEQIKALLPVVSSLGFCQNTDVDLILGKMSKSVQLQFWKSMLDILWVKSRTSREMSVSSISEKDLHGSENSIEAQMMIEQRYSECCSLIDSLATDVNMNDLGGWKINILPADIAKDIEKTIEQNVNVETLLNDFKANLHDKVSQCEEVDDSECMLDVSKLVVQCSSQMFLDCDKEEILKKISSASKQITELTEEFNQHYNCSIESVLKQAVNLSDTDESQKQMNEAIKEVHTSQKIVSQVLGNLSLDKSCYLKLKEGCDSLNAYSAAIIDSSEENQLKLTSTSLKEYTEILCGGATEKQKNAFNDTLQSYAVIKS